MAAGGFDYLVKTRIADMAAYRSVLGEVLLSLPGMRETPHIRRNGRSEEHDGAAVVMVTDRRTGELPARTALCLLPMRQRSSSCPCACSLMRHALC
jgi:hypothetical protein